MTDSKDNEQMETGWVCFCGEWTTVSHWRSGADGAGFHTTADAPPSDPSPIENQEERADNVP